MPAGWSKLIMPAESVADNGNDREHLALRAAGDGPDKSCGRRKC